MLSDEMTMLTISVAINIAIITLAMLCATHDVWSPTDLIPNGKA
jgi:hypothetical protein